MKKRKKYVPPVVYDFTSGVGGNVQAQNCRSGRNAAASCTAGANAANNCKSGIQAFSACSGGSGHAPSVDCKTGPSALGVMCIVGGYAVGTCKTGGLRA